MLPFFDISACYNAKMDSLEFFLEMGNVPIYHWSANDHEISDRWRIFTVGLNYSNRDITNF